MLRSLWLWELHLVLCGEEASAALGLRRLSICGVWVEYGGAEVLRAEDASAIHTAWTKV